MIREREDLSQLSIDDLTKLSEVELERMACMHEVHAAESAGRYSGGT